MFQSSWAVGAVASIVIAAAHADTQAADAQERAYTVDDMLALQGVQDSLVAADGRVIFEYLLPYEQSGDFRFAPSTRWANRRTQLYVIEPKGAQPARPLFAQNPGDGYLLSSLSPGGRQLAYYRIGKSDATLGVYDFVSGQTRELGVVPNLDIIYSDILQWVDESRIVTGVVAPPRAGWSASGLTKPLLNTIDRWHAAWAGERSTAQVRISGDARVQAPAAVKGSLVMIDIPSGRQTTLVAEGDFDIVSLSPDRRAVLAADKSEFLQKVTSQRIQLGPYRARNRLPLLVELSAGRRVVRLCADCSIYPNSEQWSEDGRRLAFFARRNDQEWEQGAFWIYERGAERARPVAAPGIWPVLGADRLAFEPVFPRSAWLGGRLSIFATDKGPDTGKIDNPTGSLYLLDADGRARKLSGADVIHRTDILGTVEQRWALLKDGEVMSIDERGRKRLLTADIAAPVTLGPTSDSLIAHFNTHVPRLATLLLKEKQDDREAPVRLHSIDLASGEIERLAPLDAGMEVLAAASSGGTLFVRQNGPQGDALLTIDAAGRAREAMRINAHLAGVKSATPRRIEYRGPDGARLFGWVLLPPFAAPDKRLPAVVHVYLGRVYGEQWNESGADGIRNIAMFNNQLLAAAGYAVLYPSLPSDLRDLKTDPMAGLGDLVLAAVDRAVEEGYVDAERVGIQGHSFGGYSTVAILTQTPRFKAAVAMAGPYDLFSVYGVWSPLERAVGSSIHAPFSNIGWAESSQGRLAGPPWAQVQRYLRNSPLFGVEKIATPVMLVHGDLDLVSVTQPEEMFTALYRTGKPAVFVRYDGEGHLFHSPANIRDLTARRQAWFGAYLSAE